jgi:phosphohistidine swiveling domain-containing protein
VSAALDALVEYGAERSVSREDLAYVDVSTFFSLRSGDVTSGNIGQWIQDKADEGKYQYQLSKLVELPPLIFDEAEIRLFTYPSSQANFIGSSRVVATCIDLSGGHDVSANLTGKIALIPRADPGYDWLFSREITGLITMYGGANSHMAIRAAELGLPAAIGVGLTVYERLARASILELDAGNRCVQVVE